MSHRYPILLDVTDRQILIVGGGKVAVRKVQSLLQAGATQITVVAPSIDAAMPASVKQMTVAYDPSHLESAGLVFAATDRAEINDAVVRDAQARGIWVNRADADEDLPGDFVTPATHREGEIVLAVNTGSAALSAKLRDALAGKINGELIEMAEALVELRPKIMASKLDAAQRRELFRWLASDEAMEMLAKDGFEKLSERVSKACEIDDAD